MIGLYVAVFRAGKCAVADPPPPPLHTPSQHPQTTDTLSTLRTSSTPPQANTPHSSGAHPRTDAQACPALRTHFGSNAHTPALHILPRTVSRVGTRTRTHSRSTCARTRPRTPAFVLTFSPSITCFPPPNGSCRQGGPGSAGREVPEKGSQPPAAGSTSGLQRKNERRRLLLQSRRGVQHSPWLPKSDRNAFLSLAPPPLTRRLQSEGLYRA